MEEKSIFQTKTEQGLFNSAIQMLVLISFFNNFHL